MSDKSEQYDLSDMSDELHIKMKKIILSLAAILVAATAMQARTLSPDEALSRATKGSAKAAVRGADKARLVRTTLTDKGEAAVYAFDKGSDGYMVLSADDTAYPVLGYSDSGSLAGELPPALEWWLSELSRQIDYARSNDNAGQSIEIPFRTAGKEAIAPQLTTSWDQGEPYNNQCPSYSGVRTYTGCVATAMAQIMKYWEYPVKGQGSITYLATSIQKKLSMNFALKAFDWDNMISTYSDGNYTPEQADAVAYLMKAAAYAVKMDFGIDSSGALAMDITNAFTKYFGYDGNIKYRLRSLYSADEWAQMVYDNLKNVGPVMYGGGSMIGGGHSFVCDGYDGNGYFHFNWGWTGMSDGYFTLDALNPYALGTGGGGGGGYNFTQDAVFGIQPPTGEPVVEDPVTLIQNGSLAGVIDKNNHLHFDLFAENGPMWVNYNPTAVKLTLGGIIKKVGDASFEPYFESPYTIKFELATGYGTSPKYVPAEYAPGIDLNTLAPGVYDITVATILDGETEPVPVQYTHGYYNTVRVLNMAGTYSVINYAVDRLEVTDAHFVGELYYGLPVTVSITVRNDSDIQMSRGFAPCFIQGETVVMLGESILLSVDPHSEVTREWTTDVYQLDQYFSVEQDTPLTFTLFDESTYNMWQEDCWKTVTMHPMPSYPLIKQNSVISIPGATKEIDLYNLRAINVINGREVPVACDLKLESGYYNYVTFACMLPDGNSLDLLDYYGHRFSINEGETKTFTTTVNFATAEYDTIYKVMIGLEYGGRLFQIGDNVAYVKLKELSGIEGISTEAGADLRRSGSDILAEGLIEIYSLQGTLVASGFDAVSLDTLPTGLYIARAGNKSLKFAK